jgi:hypothetical protein
MILIVTSLMTFVLCLLLNGLVNLGRSGVYFIGLQDVGFALFGVAFGIIVHLLSPQKH